ncbi:MAG: serine/threonine-protein phosphatase, partial [Ruminococcus sp.]|nr:serine/threonine-protein phosphatase [Ruminococcus sp.]
MRCRFDTDIGLRREENQDAVRCEYFGHNILAVVCDGMGGERAGKEASMIAIEEFFQRFSQGYSESLSNDDIRKLLISSVSAANSVIYTKARLDFKNFGMGTTCVAAFVTSKTAFIANVGDSRAYLITSKGRRVIFVVEFVMSFEFRSKELHSFPYFHTGTPLIFGS